MIDVHGLTKSYGNRNAIENVGFHVDKGEIVGFLGPNGAGKSTTMKILTCFLPPTAGRASVAGFDCFTQSLDVRRRIGYLPENVPLYEEMTPLAYLRFVAGLKNVAGKRISMEVSEAIALCSLTSYAGKLIRYLSKGQKQRVGIAQALIGNPDVLILDEPTVGLDPQQIHEIRQMIKEMQGKRTVILSTHILPEVSMTCQRILIINKGKIVAEDTTENLTARFARNTSYELDIAGDENPEKISALLKRIHGVTRVEHKETTKEGLTVVVETLPNSDLRRELSHTVVSSGFGLLRFAPVSRSLEEIFLELVTDEEKEKK